MRLERKQSVFGSRETLRAIRNGRAVHVYIASDAGESVTVPVEEAARAAGVPVTAAGTMRELGRALPSACGLRLCGAGQGFGLKRQRLFKIKHF